eukprot:UN10902
MNSIGASGMIKLNGNAFSDGGSEMTFDSLDFTHQQQNKNMMLPKQNSNNNNNKAGLLPSIGGGIGGTKSGALHTPVRPLLGAGVGGGLKKGQLNPIAITNTTIKAPNPKKTTTTTTSAKFPGIGQTTALPTSNTTSTNNNNNKGKWFGDDGDDDDNDSFIIG